MAQGVVKWFSNEKGYGFISQPDGEDVFVHISAVERAGLQSLREGQKVSYEMERGHGIDGRHDGIVHRNLLASYAHLRDVAANPWARRFVDFVRRCKHAA